jgi:ABC-2 type transport system permease protein
MPAQLPKYSSALSVLLRSDFTTQWRNRRSVITVFLVPLIILLTWKGMVAKVGASFVLSTCITIGLIAIGLMGYSNALARDRDKGVFQRLRVTPVPKALIMISRLTVQLFLIVVLTGLVFILANQKLQVTLTPAGYLLGFLAAFTGGALYLGLGQMIAGLLRNSETVNATTRLIYFVFIMVGMFGEMGALGEEMKTVVHWSPYGTVKTILAAGMNAAWNNQASMALMTTLGYALVFSFLGIKWFRWNVK